MSAIVYEHINKQFNFMLRNILKRNIMQYKIEVWEGESLFDHTDSLHAFLSTEQIPFQASGIPVNRNDRIPHRTILQHDATRKPAGLFIIYPEAVNEIVMAIYRVQEQFGSQSYIMIAYRDEDIFRQTMKRLKSYQISKLRQNGEIEIINGQNIPIPQADWDDLILHQDFKQDIRNNIEGFIRGEEIYRKLNIPYKRGFLFAGPPGNGKTMMLKVIASTYRNFKFILFKRSSRDGNYEIDTTFALAADLSPCILCFEDLDSIFKEGISLSHFLNKLDGFENSEGVMILATTNHPEDIDPALTNRPSRFDRLWSFRNPDFNRRNEMLCRLFGLNIDKELIDDLAERTDDFSMVYLKELYISASLLAIDAGKQYPDESEINGALDLLQKQFRTAKRQFKTNEREVGFCAK